MKKIMLLILTVLLTFTVSACGDGENTSNKNIASNQVNDGVNYKVNKETYNEGSISISYPQISELGDSSKESTVNQILKEEAIKGVNYFNGKENVKVMQINYVIMLKHNDIISVKYTGVGMAKNSSEPINMIYSTNVNIKNGTKIRLKNMLSIDKNFLEIFRESSYKSLNPNKDYDWDDRNREAIESTPDGSLIEKLTNSDILDDIESKNPDHVFCYLKNNTITIAIKTEHDLGDVAEFEILTENIPKKMRINNDIWNIIESD